MEPGEARDQVVAYRLYLEDAQARVNLLKTRIVSANQKIQNLVLETWKMGEDRRITLNDLRAISQLLEDA